MTMKMNNRREGFALAAAVLAMLVVGAIVTGGFYAASQEGQVAKATDAGDMALYLAETGLNNVASQMQASTLQAMSINGITTYGASSVSYGGRAVGTYQVSVTRLAQSLFLFGSVGTVTLSGPYSGAKRTLVMVARVRSADFDNNTAVQVYGDLTVGGSSDIDGSNWTSATWSGCSTAPSGTSAVLANPTSSVTTQGTGNITGDITREVMDSSDFNVFGDLGFDEVAAMANYAIPAGDQIGPAPSYTNGQCNTSPTTNWGSPILPTDPCFTWFPIIHALGDLRISSSGTGQGILLVEGDLDVSGGFTFYGAVVVRGIMKMTGTGGHINGTLITFGDGQLSSNSSTLGNSLVQYSSCAIERAVYGNSRLSRAYAIANRSWFDLTNVQNSY